MEIDLQNFESSDFKWYDLSIVQREVGGGRTDCGQIDVIGEHPDAKTLIVSGLNQESFEYLIGRYGNQFEAITFWKNKLVSNLSPLASLGGLKYLCYFFNQRVTRLWDMSKNTQLRGLALDDFSRLHSIDGIESAPCLEYFSLGNRVWAKMDIDSLKPLTHSSVTHFAWWGNKVLDDDFSCLAQSNIKRLDLNICRFTMEQLAKLNASIPGLQGKAAIPYKEGGVTDQNGRVAWYFLCKGKRRLEKGRDEEKLEKYLMEFDGLVERYREDGLHAGDK